MVVVSHSSFFCSIVVDSNANVIEVMPSGGSHDTKRPRQSDGNAVASRLRLLDRVGTFALC